MVGFLISVIVLAVSLLIISKIPPVGVEIDSPVKALIGGAIIGAFNGIYSLFPNVLTTGVAILSLGLIPPDWSHYCVWPGRLVSRRLPPEVGASGAPLWELFFLPL